MNKHCWNGNFYTHFVKKTPVTIHGVDETVQLSLSNPININRGVTGHEMAVSIIQEYQKRNAVSNSFAEWYSIDPPFPDGIFGDEKIVAGAYINGGIMPLVGGELALAALNHGFEEYGISILKKYSKMISSSGKTYLWYFPDGNPSAVETSTSPDAEPTDGWGSSAMLYALVEGLAGVSDQYKKYERIRLSPRWNAADIKNAEVKISYAVSGAGIMYKYVQEEEQILMDVQTRLAEVDFHILIPENCMVSRVENNGKAQFFRMNMVEKSNYVDFTLNMKDQNTIKIILVKKDDE